MNASGAPIVAVDLPSGINGASGAVMGAAVMARESITFFRRKPGHRAAAGTAACRLCALADIGIPDSVLERVRPHAFANGPACGAAPFRSAARRAQIFARARGCRVGRLSFTGAARLAARGALRAGAGLVTLASPRDALAVNAAASLAVMVRAVDWAGGAGALLADPAVSHVALGPGLAGRRAGRGRLVQSGAARCERAVVLDADALTFICRRAGRAVRRHCGPGLWCVTPHQGEFAADCQIGWVKPLTRWEITPVPPPGPRGGRRACSRVPTPWTPPPDGRAAINVNAPPWLVDRGFRRSARRPDRPCLLAQGMPGLRGRVRRRLAARRGRQRGGSRD
jgi:hypothetical protein